MKISIIKAVILLLIIIPLVHCENSNQAPGAFEKLMK